MRMGGLESGVRVGPQTLGAILCDADVEVIGRTGDGEYLNFWTQTTDCATSPETGAVGQLSGSVCRRWL